jgi:DNA-binding response OmpR family regulator
MDMVKGEELDAFDRSIDVHVSRLRAAIEPDPKHPRRIITVRGAGYVFARYQDDV